MTKKFLELKLDQFLSVSDACAQAHLGLEEVLELASKGQFDIYWPCECGVEDTNRLVFIAVNSTVLLSTMRAYFDFDRAMTEVVPTGDNPANHNKIMNTIGLGKFLESESDSFYCNTCADVDFNENLFVLRKDVELLTKNKSKSDEVYPERVGKYWFTPGCRQLTFEGEFLCTFGEKAAYAMSLLVGSVKDGNPGLHIDEVQEKWEASLASRYESEGLSPDEADEKVRRQQKSTSYRDLFAKKTGFNPWNNIVSSKGGRGYLILDWEPKPEETKKK